MPPSAHQKLPANLLPPKLHPRRDLLLLILSLAFSLFTFLPWFGPVRPWHIAVFVLAGLGIIGWRGCCQIFEPLRQPTGLPWLSALLLPLALFIAGPIILTGDWSPSPTSFDANFLARLGLILLLALAEEIAIRLAIFRLLTRKISWIPAAIISSLLFGILHMPLGGPMAGLFPFAGGLIYCWSYHRSRTLLFPILLHCANNLFWFLW